VLRGWQCACKLVATGHTNPKEVVSGGQYGNSLEYK
jgi:hypothetical protein